MAGTSHYEVLGIRADASTAEIRKAYHRLARDHHPDRFADPEQKRDAEQRFASMTEAFNVLSNAERRRSYDDQLRAPSSSEPSAQREAKSYFRAAAAKLAAGEPKEAVRLLRAAIHLDPAPAAYYAALAGALEADSDFGDASRQWEEAVKREPHNAAYYRLAGQCLERAGMKIRARRMYESALRWDRGDAVAAEALRRLGGEDEKKSGLLGGLFKRS